MKTNRKATMAFSPLHSLEALPKTGISLPGISRVKIRKLFL